MKDIWKRIHAWLDANAPKGYGHLCPGASVEAIRVAEQAMGLKIPADVKASYRIHDGQLKEPGLIGGEGWCLMTLQAMAEFWKKWCKSSRRYRSCVPVAWGGADHYIFVDMSTNAEKQGQRHRPAK